MGRISNTQYTAQAPLIKLNCCVKKCQTFSCPSRDPQTAQISVLWITRSGLSCSIVSTANKSIVWMNWNGGSPMSGAVLKSRFLMRLLISGERHRARVHAKGGHFEYSLWTDNVDYVHICYIPCDLFDCCIFNYEIMPATLANTFLFILQDSTLADLRYGCRFYDTRCHS